MQGRSIPVSSSLPLLIPSFASSSPSLPSPDPSWCFPFFLFFSSFFPFFSSFFLFFLPFSSSSEEGPPLNMGATGAEFGRTSKTSLKKTSDGSMCLVVVVVIVFFYFFIFFIFFYVRIVIHLLYRLV